MVNDQLVVENHPLLCATWQTKIGAHCARRIVKIVDRGATFNASRC